MGRWKRIDPPNNHKFGICTWRFVQGPERLMMWHSGETLEDVLAEVPDNMMDDRMAVIRIRGWLRSADDPTYVLPDPDQVSTVFEIQAYDGWREYEEGDDEDEEDAA